MKVRRSKLVKLWQDAHAMGAAGTHVAQTAIFATRYTPAKNAGDADSRRSAIGIGPHSVWNGPRMIPGGAPVLRRNKTA